MMKEVGRYRIDKFLGSGGMGKVYRAFDPVIGRHVAIKTISLRRYGDADERQNLLERLRREARSAGKLSHTGIVTIHDFIEQGDLACLVMEFIDGISLKEMLKSQPALEGRAALSILRQTASALDYAHTGGIVHRDIKPGNLIVQKDGAAKILDFGVAKLSSAHSLTETGFSIGTPEYMSPEQYQGGTLDGRADQFSLGVITYEMLTGVRPFAADTPLRVMYRVMGEEPALAHELNPSLGAEAAQVLRQALSKDPEARFDTCQEFTQALEETLGRAPGWQPMPRSSKGPATPPRVETAEQETPSSTATPDRPAPAAAAKPTPEAPPSPRRGTPVRPTPGAGAPRVQPPARPARKLAGVWGFLGVIGVTLALGLGGLYLFLANKTPSTRQEQPSPIEEPRPAPKPEITTDSKLPDAVAGASYMQTLNASGGTAPLRWSVTAGSLPGGLDLDLTSGALSGTPVRAGSYSFTVQARNSAQLTATREFSLTVQRRPPETELVFLTSPALPEATMGRTYSQRLMVSGGTPPYRWSARAASLPAGLSLEPAEGTLSGTPSSAGRFPFTVRVTDSEQVTASQQFALNVARAAAPPTPPVIRTPAVLPPATVGTEYSQALSASGGKPPYSWSLAGGSLPAGLSLDGARGVISGTPTAPGDFKFRLQVTDSAQATTPQDFALRVGRLVPILTITTPSALPNAAAGVSYTQAVSASGGAPSYSWTVSEGALPAGLALDSARAVISGTPAAEGVYQFTLRVSDTAQTTASKPITLRVERSLRITSPPTLPGGSAGRAYSYELSAAGGRPPYQWSLTGGSPPPGLALDETRGVLSGTLTRSGDFRFTVRVTDGARGSDTAQLSLAVSAQQGTLVWQGELAINMPLIIQGRNASAGSLTGELPGTPVRVEVVEPAGVVIVTAPGPGVGWKNMVLNSPYQRQTRIVIRWTESR